MGSADETIFPPSPSVHARVREPPFLLEKEGPKLQRSIPWSSIKANSAPRRRSDRGTNRVRRGRRRPKGSDGGESFPPVAVRKGDRKAGSAVFFASFVIVRSVHVTIFIVFTVFTIFIVFIVVVPVPQCAGA